MLGVYDYTVILTYISLWISIGGMMLSLNGHLDLAVLYHAIRNRRTAGADLLYEERENSNPGINACIDDCHDYI